MKNLADVTGMVLHTEFFPYQPRNHRRRPDPGVQTVDCRYANALMDEENRIPGPQLGKFITDSAIGFAVPLRVSVAKSNG